MLTALKILVFMTFATAVQTKQAQHHARAAHLEMMEAQQEAAEAAGE